jgi:hypothetical protein
MLWVLAELHIRGANKHGRLQEHPVLTLLFAEQQKAL